MISRPPPTHCQPTRYLPRVDWLTRHCASPFATRRLRGGWGLQFRDLAHAFDGPCTRSTAARSRAQRVSKERSTVLLLRFFVRGCRSDTCRFGAYRGGNAMFMAGARHDRAGRAGACVRTFAECDVTLDRRLRKAFGMSTG